MRVGFVTSLLWERYGPPWAALVRDVGARVVLPAPDDVASALDDPRCEALEPLAPRLALASALACGRVDLLVVPELIAPRDGGPGAAQDPWVADLPTMLGRALAGGPGVVSVPVERGDHVTNVVVPILARINRDAGQARRAWERRRRELVTPWLPADARARGVEGQRVALAAHPWWLASGAIELARLGAGSLVGQHQLDPAIARAEGRRVLADLTDPDAEAIGGARRFARQAATDVVRLVIDARSPTASWLERRVRGVAGASLEVVHATDLADDETWARTLTPAPSVE